jgi:hypothetical protein
LKKWSEDHPNHTVVTIILDLKFGTANSSNHVRFAEQLDAAIRWVCREQERERAREREGEGVRESTGERAIDARARERGSDRAREGESEVAIECKSEKER